MRCGVFLFNLGSFKLTGQVPYLIFLTLIPVCLCFIYICLSYTQSRSAGPATTTEGRESEPVTRVKRARPSRSESPRAKSSRVEPLAQPVDRDDVSDRANTPDPSSISLAPVP